ncbi:fasciclin domain-containing protein [uncultured Lacinutrix sp.]|uniref:fasciclin domain-containing protein n=1 Tax=uncultured Lacinutrix sp. TaxID=574032 RepID=UPI0026295828|nr:fasciclin domain-containing protein [uncultured Lacinutrix sp.]
MKTLKKLSLLVLVVFTFSACSNDDDASGPIPNPTPTLNIVQTAQATADLSLLVDAVVQADLATTLSGTGPFTVLAPTNAAFQELLDSNTAWNSIADIDNATLTQILLNHVISGTVTSSDLTTAGSGYSNTMADAPGGNKMSIYFDTSNGVQFNGLATVSTPDVAATNGIVHIVNKVITLPTIATFATTNPNLSNLVATLQLADTGTPTVPYIDTVSDATAGPYTVFAPTNDAFVSLLTELNLTALTDVDAATADAILLYHIVNANVQSTDLPNGPVTTLGGDITADNTAFTLTDVNNRVSGIITTLVNIQAVNGVVHAIDKVILPLQM